MSRKQEVEQVVRSLYDDMGAGEILGIPSDALRIKWKVIKRHGNRWMRAYKRKGDLEIRISATDLDCVKTVVAEWIATDVQLKRSQYFGVRHVELSSGITIFHLLTSLTLVVIAGSILPNYPVGMMLTSLGASLSQPFFVVWGINSMRLREEEINRNLLVAKEYADVEPEKTKYWWKDKDYKRHLIKFALIWQCYLIPIFVFSLFLYTLS